MHSFTAIYIEYTLYIMSPDANSKEGIEMKGFSPRERTLYANYIFGFRLGMVFPVGFYFGYCTVVRQPGALQVSLAKLVNHDPCAWPLAPSNNILCCPV